MWPQGGVKKKAVENTRTRSRGRRIGSVEEDRAVYGRRTEVSVRQAKDNLSALLMRAAAGEEIIVTSDGRPKAMITRLRTELRLKPWRVHPDLSGKLPELPDSTALIRDERDAKG